MPLLSTEGSDAGLVLGLIVLVLLIIGGVLAVVWYGWKRSKLCAKAAANGGISFENPSYIREQNGDTVQVSIY